MLLSALSLFAVLAPMGASAQGKSEAAKNCQQGGYADWSARAGGPPFATTQDCVTAGARGTIYPAPTISTVREGTRDIYGQMGNGPLYCFFWVTYNNLLMPAEIPFNIYDKSLYAERLVDVTFYHDGVFDSVLPYLIMNGDPAGDIVPFGKTQVIVVTDRQTGEVLVTGEPQVCEAPA